VRIALESRHFRIRVGDGATIEHTGLIAARSSNFEGVHRMKLSPKPSLSLAVLAPFATLWRSRPCTVSRRGMSESGLARSVLVVVALGSTLGLVGCGESAQDVEEGAAVQDSASTSRKRKPSPPSSGKSSGAADGGAGALPRDGGSTPTASSDPFNPASCDGPIITKTEVAARFAAGATTAPAGKFTVYSRERDCSALTGCAPWTATTVNAKGTATFFANSAANQFDLIIDDDRNDPRCLVHEATERSGLGRTYGIYDLPSFRFSDVTADPTQATFDILNWQSIAVFGPQHYIYGCSTTSAQWGGGAYFVLTGRVTNTCVRATNERTDSLGNLVSEVVLSMSL
jgi:hypothetical protein